MSTIKVHVKWGKKKLENLELNLNEPPSVFKSQLYSLTGVLPERQKIMVKGGTLKDDADWKTLGIKDGHAFMMMGSAESDIPTEPVSKPVFVEDLPQDQVSAMEVVGYPAGLQNLGNTCYMNATLQCLRSVPELTEALKRFPDKVKENATGGSNNLTASMRDLFVLLDNTNQSMPPLMFLQVLRAAFPQFAQKGQSGVYMQQDAEECWTQVMLSLGQGLPAIKSSGEPSETPAPSSSSGALSTNSAVGQIFGGELESVWTNTESSEEPKVVKKDSFFKLPCHITSNTNFLMDGLRASMEEHISKKSELLGREADYLKSSKISKLPYYLTIQFVRFFWKQGAQVKAKIGRPVEFPFVLDIFDFCTDELKQQLLPKRKMLIEYEEKKMEQESKKAKSGKEEVKEKETKPMDIELDPSKYKNETGFYELFAVLTHKGRNADSGHYVAWVKNTEDKWWLFDDDEVSVVSNEDIKKLSGKGGSDWHLAYLCLYRSKKLPADLEQVVQKQ